MCVCVCMCVYLCVYVQVDKYLEVRDYFCLLTQGLSLNLPLTVGFTRWPVSFGGSLVSLLQYWDYWYVLLHLAFTWMLWIQTQVVCLPGALTSFMST